MEDHLESLVKNRPFWWRGEEAMGDGMLLFEYLNTHLAT